MLEAIKKIVKKAREKEIEISEKTLIRESYGQELCPPLI
jgi:hypothetical protein